MKYRSSDGTFKDVPSFIINAGGGVGQSYEGKGEIFNIYEGIFSNIASGEASHAEGFQTKAIGQWSHAEGDGTTATGSSSHAEGAGTQANNSSSHVEGINSHAEGVASHAEGNYVYAIGMCSHAEGEGSHAEGVNSHSEGDHTVAKGDNSHVEGLRTIAKEDCQHVQGKYNTDNSNATFIIGNGTDEIHRSNLFEVTKDNGVIYKGKDISNPYSTTAVAIGSWINGNTIYRKVIEVTENLAKDNLIKVADFNPNVMQLIKGFGIIETTEGSYSNNDILVYAASDGIYAKQNFTSYPKKLTIILEYTSK